MTTTRDTRAQAAVPPARRPYEKPALAHHGSVAVQTADNNFPPTLDATFFANHS
ncbi:hypothetical protein FDG2_2779 [Candidatus Protofrankia californiensis]|uniref:Uncharacterized protein n=1 Tax=Candidatus Protofrankia californiensis TaxID=1839754 RepID=A0A1C3NY86_9ACTN|nr:hypothetical protein FDG2_2779 [Candidatus Protofrankia californiensis]